ncbi:MAG: hypothetical protein H6831_06195 [Planctomycetes bacterium]|nr:hypothetical protein [Planctomycetota bacterium]MCB9903979.1 hypothetical protein [Planctomycetota bacterium]
MKPILPRPSSWLAALAACALASCSTMNRAFDALDVINLPETRAYNLEQLHQADHHHRHVAHQTGDVQYLMKRGIAGFQPGRHIYDEAQVEKIDDPSIECLAELVSLCKFDSSSTVTSSLQVEWCVRLAVEDSWRLSRERALFELGRAALRLDVGVPQGLPEGAASPVDEVVAAITKLIRAYRPTVEGSESSLDDDQWVALEDAVAGIRALTLDLESGRRTLKAINSLLGPTKRTGRVRGMLEPLALDVQRTLVSQAITAGLNDPLPSVRAVAVWVAVQSGGDVVLAQSLTQLGPQTSEEVIMTVMRLVELYGLPEENAELSGEIFERVRLQWLGIIVEFAVNHPSGEVRVRCMRALREASGGALDTLREEDWQQWWTGVLEARESGVLVQP